MNLKFSDDIDLIAGTKEELQELTDQQARNATWYGMEFSSEKTKVMVNSIHANINLYGEHLEEVDQFF